MAYATTTQLKTYLNISGNSDDALLGDLLARAQAAIERYCGRRFEALSATRYYTLTDVDGDTLYVDDDLLTVTTLTNGNGAVIGSSDYVLIPRNVTPKVGIKLLSTAQWEQDTDSWISVAGTWGYSATAPADIVQATIRLAGYMYRQRDATTYDTVAFPDAGVMTVPQGIPRDVALLLEPYRRVRLTWA